MRRAPRQHKLLAEPYTQWEPGVASPGSACGPATIAALMEYWRTRKGRIFIPGASHFASKAAHINHIYSHHGGTPWGMSVGSFTKGVKAYIRSSAPLEAKEGGLFSVSVFNDMDRYKAEIDAERPVALKFDKWFTLRWRGTYAYDYHWVLGIGYQEPEGGGGPVLIVHDNGMRHKHGGFTPGQARLIPYTVNKDVITMVALDIKEASIGHQL
ncbi:hypothetical protein BSK56_16300 [Paenibacillus borealis]|uniref:Peptidase C39-like domain-containing protein n=1 Tax=Paenibacillus borealis TaxID=160799 RepID=A0ABX3H8V1_PAEBO|nr:C39 family peptidase [Paenibacillus borealis]OMD46400.1 hypothetical protein BSK56_16300 [Paenibacillus borealis]